MNTVFLLLFLLSLLGFFIFIGRALINLIKKNPVKKNFKMAGISAAVCIASLVGFGFTMEIIDPESIELSIPDYQNEYDINTKIPLEVSTSPENADKIHFEYISNGDTLTFSDSSIKTGSEPGVYEIYIESGDVKSNTLSVTVVDMDARNAEQEAAEKQISEPEKPAKEEDNKSTATQEIPAETQSENEMPTHTDSDPKTTAADSEKPEENPADALDKESEENTTDAPVKEEKEEEEEDPLGFNVLFSSTYRNDVTGNWRLARIAEDIDIENYAVEYYKHYFDSDDEVHIIINFTRNTTTRINKFGNLLDVTTMDYVKGEEHDAEIACSGTLLSEYFVDMDSGEIEKIQ